MPPTRSRYLRIKLNDCNHENQDCYNGNQQPEISTSTKNENQYSTSNASISSSDELPDANNHCYNSNFVLPTNVNEYSNDISGNVKLNDYIKMESVDEADNSEDIILETEEDDQSSFIEDTTFEDDADLIVGIPPKRIKRVRKSTAGKRNIQRYWSDDEINKLIAAVEKRRPLWDLTLPEYKLSKTDSWHEVADELDLGNVDIGEIKNKWSSLRVTFRTNVAKLRKKKSGDGTDDSTIVPWRHFKSMLFLEVSDVRQSTSTSTSTLALENAIQDKPLLNDSPEPSESLPMISVGKRKCRTPTSMASTSSANTSTAEILKTPMHALKTSDVNSTFSVHVLAELRSLSPANARSLRKILSEAMWKFFDDLEEVQQQQ